MKLSLEKEVASFIFQIKTINSFLSSSNLSYKKQIIYI